MAAPGGRGGSGAGVRGWGEANVSVDAGRIVSPGEGELSILFVTYPSLTQHTAITRIHEDLQV